MIITAFHWFLPTTFAHNHLTGSNVFFWNFSLLASGDHSLEDVENLWFSLPLGRFGQSWTINRNEIKIFNYSSMCLATQWKSHIRIQWFLVFYFFTLVIESLKNHFFSEFSISLFNHELSKEIKMLTVVLNETSTKCKSVTSCEWNFDSSQSEWCLF